MKKAWTGCFVFVVLLAGGSTPAQEHELTKSQIVNTLRVLNTAQFNYLHENKHVASLDQLLPFMRDNRSMRYSPVDLSAENLKPYELLITITPDGRHYQISLVPTSNMSDQST